MEVHWCTRIRIFDSFVHGVSSAPANDGAVCLLSFALKSSAPAQGCELCCRLRLAGLPRRLSRSTPFSRYSQRWYADGWQLCVHSPGMCMSHSPTLAFQVARCASARRPTSDAAATFHIPPARATGSPRRQAACGSHRSALKLPAGSSAA